jgi:hypothetical protein
VTGVEDHENTRALFRDWKRNSKIREAVGTNTDLPIFLCFPGLNT